MPGLLLFSHNFTLLLQLAVTNMMLNLHKLTYVDIYTFESLFGM